MKSKKRGFTMAEVLITVAILLIIMMIGFTSYLFWMKNSKFKFNNENAQTFFALVQTDLTSKRNHGSLEELKGKLDKYAESDSAHCGTLSADVIGKLTLDDGEHYSNGYDSLYTGYQLKGGPIYYLKGTDDDYNKYLAGESSGAVKLLYDLLSEYVMASDSDLLHGDFCLEFDPKEGLVYSVFYRSLDSLTYADKTDALSYSTETLLDRTENTRKSYMIGYFGVHDLSQSNSAESVRTTISNLALNNEETLNLTFNVGVGTVNNIDPSIFYYQIDLYDSKNDSKVMTITMNKDVDTNSHLNAVNGHGVGTTAVKYAADGSVIAGSEKTMSFPAWVKDSKVTFVLDAIDYAAASVDSITAYTNYANGSTEGAYCDGLRDTASIYRLGLDSVDNLYCKVTCLGDGYKSSLEKQSNTEARAFASTEKGDEALATFMPLLNSEKEINKIAYSRHLFNVRFEEAAKQAGSVNEYTVIREVKWRSTTGLASDGVLYNKLVAINDDETRMGMDFLSIPVLTEYSVLGSAETGYGYALSDFSISSLANDEYKLFASTGEGTGLVAVNKGYIENLTMKDCKISGAECTGSFAGVNRGYMEYLQTEVSSVGSENSDSSGRVNGTEHVGGILGKAENTSENMCVAHLKNSSTVSGQKYVGGILGMAVGTGIDVTIEDCENYGFIAANGEDSQYLGGIVGLAANQSSDKSFVINRCISIPRQGKNEATLLDVNNGYINGYCVGGIVGMAYNTSITNCETYKNKYFENGFVVGKDYVGGIAGMYVGGGIIGKNAGDKDYCINQARVFGNSYVGGIVGCNADVNIEANEGETLTVKTLESFIKANSNWYEKLDASKLKPKADVNYSLKVQGWENRGVVVSLTNYAGGVTGYNTGIVYDCISNVSSNGTSFFSADSKYGDYVGGIAGYNSGIVTGSKYDTTSGAVYVSDAEHELLVNAVVTGGNFVGGIVGYNDAGAIAEDYQVTGGTIRATGNCVGGYAGFNASEKLFEKGNGSINKISTAVSTIQGKYYVGGVIGYNCVKPSKDIKAAMEVNNLLAKINGEAVVGGFIGYNQLTAENPTISSVVTFAKYINDLSNQEIINKAETGMELSSSQYKLFIGSEDSSLIANNAGIKAKICAGGVIGYDQKDSRLYLKNISNSSIVETNGFVTYDGDTKFYSDNSKQFDVSYTGGVIGYVNEKTVVDGCKNINTGDVIANGYYNGSVAEINSGTITNCAIENSVSGFSFTGGICGINYGTIEKTNFGNKGKVTGAGGNFIGGIVCENYGQIEVNGTGTIALETSGNNAGGVAAYNGGNACITLTGDTKVDIHSYGAVVGGLVGINGSSATITNESGAKVWGTVVGESTVGGIVGDYESTTPLSGLINSCDVSATDGYAAGIACDYKASEIENCKNIGTIISASNDAAGIVLSVPVGGAAIDCSNKASVSAPKGRAGGICVTNNGKVDNCVVEGVNSKIVISGVLAVGGVATENNGEITVDKFKNVVVSNTQDSDNHNLVGGVTGRNNETGSIVFKNSVEKYEDIVVRNYIGDIPVGGIAGVNLGTIKSDSAEGEKPARIYISQIDTVGVTSANIGGVAGQNDGTITNILLTGTSENMLSDALSGNTVSGYYGGIAGYNNGNIKDCSFNGFMSINGSKRENALGGIVGYNSISATVESCYLADDSATAIGIKKLGSLGGIVGWNEGKIYSCNNFDEERVKPLAKSEMIAPLDYGSYDGVPKDKKLNTHNYRAVLINNSGYTAGICGYNGPSGICTGTEDKPMKSGLWYIEMKVFINDNGVSGGVAYVKSGEDIEYFYNHANIVCSFETASLRNTILGGITGNVDNGSKIGQRISNCYNYGTIYSSMANYASGIYGRVTGYRPVIENCINYGDIYGGNAAGIVSAIHSKVSGDPTPLTIKNCVNYGKISSEIKVVSDPQKNWSVAGICGHVDSSVDVRFEIVDCVNNGEIINAFSKTSKEAESQASGIIVFCSADSTVIRCRNYAKVENRKYDGNAFGISYKGKVYDSFDFYVPDESGHTQKLTGGTVEHDSYVYSQNHVIDSIDSKPYHIYFEQENGKYVLKSGLGKVNTVGGIPSTENAAFGFEGSSYENLYELLENGKIGENSYIQQYYIDMANSVINADIAKVEGLAANVVAGDLQLYWKPANNALQYEVTITNKGNNKAYTFVTDGNSLFMTVPDDLYGNNLGIKVRGIAGKAVGQYSNELTRTYGHPLPTPDVHLELGGYTSTGIANPENYVLVLENYEDYLEFFEKYNISEANRGKIVIEDANTSGRYALKITLDPKNINTYTDVDGNLKYYVASDTCARVKNGATNNRLHQFYAYSTDAAIATETIRTTGSSMEWGLKGDGHALELTDMVAWKDVYFTGIYSDRLEANILAYYAGTSTNNTFDQYERAEILVDQRTKAGRLLKDAVVSSNNIHVDYGNTINAPTTIILGDLPENVLQSETKKVTIQSYHTITQRYVAYAGYDVAVGVTEDKLLSVKNYRRVGADGAFGEAVLSCVDDVITANAGYMIYMNTDEEGNVTYDVRYNTFLRYENEYYVHQVNRATFTIDSIIDEQKKIDKATENAVSVQSDSYVQFRPEISDLIVIHDNGYTVNWNTNANKSKVSIYGIVKDENGITTDKILLDEAETAENTYTFVDKASSWDYESYVFRVMSIGSMSRGKSYLLPYYVETPEIDVNKRYARIAAPVINVPSDVNSMDYSVSWKTLAEFATDKLNAVRDFSTYEITVEDVAGIIPTTYYYTSENGTLSRGIMLKDVSVSPGMMIMPKSLVNDNLISGTLYVAEKGEKLTTGITINSIHGTDGVIAEDTILGVDSVFTKGSVLVAGTKLPAGTKIDMAFVVDEALLEDGVLIDEYTLDRDVVLKDRITIGGQLKLVKGTVIGKYSVINNTVSGILEADYTATEGTLIYAGSLIKEGTVVLSNKTVQAGTMLDAGDVIGKGTVLPEGTVLVNGMTLVKGTVIPAGTILPTGTILPAGTIITGTVSRIGDPSIAVTVPAGTVLPAGSISNIAIADYNITAKIPLAYSIVTKKDYSLAKTKYIYYCDTYLGKGTILPKGTVVPTGSYLSDNTTGIENADVKIVDKTLTGDVTLAGYLMINGEMVVPEGGITLSMPARLGHDTVLSEDMTLSDNMKLGGKMEVLENLTVPEEIVLGTETTLMPGSLIKKGTILSGSQIIYNVGEKIPAGTIIDGAINLPSNFRIDGYLSVLPVETKLTKNTTLISGVSVLPAGTVFSAGAGITTGTRLPKGTSLYGSINIPAGITIPSGSVISSTDKITWPKDLVLGKDTNINTVGTLTLNTNAKLAGEMEISTVTFDDNITFRLNTGVSDAEIILKNDTGISNFSIPEGMRIVADDYVYLTGNINMPAGSTLKVGEADFTLAKSVKIPQNTILPKNTVFVADGSDYVVAKGFIIPAGSELYNYSEEEYTFANAYFWPKGTVLPAGTRFANAQIINGVASISVLEQDVKLGADYKFSGNTYLPAGKKIIFEDDTLLSADFTIKNGFRLKLTNGCTVNLKLSKDNLFLELPANSELTVGNEVFTIISKTTFSKGTEIIYNSDSPSGNSATLKPGMRIVVPKDRELKFLNDTGLKNAIINVNSDGYIVTGADKTFTIGKANIDCLSDVTLTGNTMTIEGNGSSVKVSEIRVADDQPLSITVGDQNKLYLTLSDELVFGDTYKIVNKDVIPGKVEFGDSVVAGRDLILTNYKAQADIILNNEASVYDLFGSGYILTSGIDIPFGRYILDEDVLVDGAKITIKNNYTIRYGDDAYLYNYYNKDNNSMALIPAGTVIGGYVELTGETDLMNEEIFREDMLLTEDMVVEGEMTIKAGSVLSGEEASSVYDYTQRLSEKEIAQLLKAAGNPENNSIHVAMDNYDDCTINVSVRALAKIGAEKYSSSYPGNVRTIQITSRLKSPNVDLLTAETGAADGYVLQKQLAANGIDLTFENTLIAGESVNGRYEVKLFICDAEGNILKAIDMSKLNSSLMNGNLALGTYNITNELYDADGKAVYITEYAGKYIYVALRATSENAISSYWTDEDDRVTSYAHFRIPDIKRDTPSLSNETILLGYAVHGISEEGMDDVISKLNIMPAQKKISFEYQNVDGYSIQLVRDLGKNSDGEVQRTADTLTVKRNEEGIYTVIWNGADSDEEAGISLSAVTDRSAELDETSWSKLSDLGMVYELPYVAEVGEDNIASYSRVYSKINAWLVIENQEDQAIVHLILPDNDTSDASGTGLPITGKWTSGISVIALAESEHYINSDGSHMTGNSSNIGALGENIGVTILGTRIDSENRILKVSLSGNTGNLRSLIKISRDGKDYIYSMEGKDSAGNVNEIDLYKTALGELRETDTLQLAFINISDNSVSKWFDFDGEIIWGETQETETTPGLVPEQPDITGNNDESESNKSDDDNQESNTDDGTESETESESESETQAETQ